MNGYFTFPKPLELESDHLLQFSVIPPTLVYACWRDLTFLQGYSRRTHQPQLTELSWNVRISPSLLFFQVHPDPVRLQSIDMSENFIIR